MPSLADLPELVGFFSYSREDDVDSDGALSRLRDRIQRELRSQIGRAKTDFRLWQDREAIAFGKMWEAEITDAVQQAVFFIPIITPTAIKSRHCKFEFDAFLQREKVLGRTDLVFPIYYIRVAELEDETRWRSDPLLRIVGARQWADWKNLRHEDISSPRVREAIAQFCAQIVEALDKHWVPPLPPDEENWRRIGDSQNAALLRDHVERFPNSPTTALARARLERSTPTRIDVEQDIPPVTAPAAPIQAASPTQPAPAVHEPDIPPLTAPAAPIQVALPTQPAPAVQEPAASEPRAPASTAAASAQTSPLILWGLGALLFLAIIYGLVTTYVWPSSTGPATSPATNTAAPVSYPTKAITLIVPTAAGGAADTFARTLANSMSIELRTQVAVDNRPGSAGQVAFTYFQGRAVDPHVLLIWPLGFAIPQGFKGYAVATVQIDRDTFGVVAPSNTPSGIIARLNAVIAKTYATRAQVSSPEWAAVTLKISR